jgi:hypothetical protein
MLEFLTSEPVMKWFWRIGAVMLGGTGGYLYYKFIGCTTNSCPITSNPWLSILYGALIGFLLIRK